MAELIVLEITSQCFSNESNLFLSNENTYRPLSIDDELTFGVVDDVKKQIEKALHRLKCFVEAATNAVKDTDLTGLWKPIEKDVDDIISHVKACKNTENKVGEIM